MKATDIAFDGSVVPILAVCDNLQSQRTYWVDVNTVAKEFGGGG